MRPEVKQASAAVEFETTERCLDRISERYIIVSGQGLVEVDDLEPIDVLPGDVVRIPADVAQRITNTGKGDLIFYAVCAPPFRQTSYVSLE
jgi:mannose-6-phosphate isomerase-like protein (cupin superfamily)